MNVKVALSCSAMLLVTTLEVNAAGAPRDRIHALVDRTILPLMAKEHIPGVAVGIVLDGTPYAFTYGVASKTTMQPVTSETLFEIESVSKTFTATLASYAELRGDLSLPQRVGAYLRRWPARRSAMRRSSTSARTPVTALRPPLLRAEPLMAIQPCDESRSVQKFLITPLQS